ncbi:MAG: prepilin-type N-terminal cleavage/methylation domain-containing protein [Candidatus Electrothrix sp. AUS1_2]|nr:prepilin-type N-terminal cleavage/methylation domain-containing protein [Candidatus Electrothrix sp. AUS1_2]
MMQGEINRKNSGFTLIELIVSLVISSFVVAGIYGVYTIQQRSYKVQEQVSEMQQRLRAAVQFMTSEMRMAGYNPPNDYPDPHPYDPAGVCDGAKIVTANRDAFEFKFCVVENAPTYTSKLQKTAYSLYDAGSKSVFDFNLGVEHDSGKMPLAEGIEAIEFLYFDQNDNPVPPVTGDTGDIRTVKISLLARAMYPDAKYTDTTVYEPASGNADWFNGGKPPNDHYHRRLLITTVKLRNMGLE